jgi:Tol biopolymer transport system component
VYFVSERSGREEVWKVRAGGGEATQVTSNGGYTAFESPDGKSLYYKKADDSTGLWKMPVSGGPENQVLPSVVYRAFSVTGDGIYFIPESGMDGKTFIEFLSFSTGKVKRVALIPGQVFLGLSASPDGRSILFTQVDQEGIDLMLVENFR